VRQARKLQVPIKLMEKQNQTKPKNKINKNKKRNETHL
jgi:hypothetical protein